MVKMNSMRATVSSKSNTVERIRQMKSYNHLMEKTKSPSNIRLAIKKAAKGKRSRKRVRQMLENTEEFIPFFQDKAYLYKHRMKQPKKIYDGITRKQREIIVPSFDEQVMHHMVVNILQPIIEKGMYDHVHGSIPKRGPVKGKKQIEKWIRNSPKRCRYVLKMDIRHFFGSIPHDKLIAFIEKRIHDKMFMRLVKEVIDCTPVGLPLGFHTSHWIANWYLQSLDHFIKQKLGAEYYMRYMDDMVIFGSNKRKLHKMKDEIERYLNEELGLEMKDNWQVFKFDYVDKNGKTVGRALDFMGYRFFRNRKILRKSIMHRMCRRAKRIWKKEKPTIYDCRQMMSALGWIRSTNSYGMYLERIKPYVCFRYMRKRISRFDKRMIREGGLLCGGSLKTQPT